MTPLNTIGELVHHIRTTYTNPKALNYYLNGVWYSISTDEFVTQVRELSLGLLALGLKKAERVGILVPSSPFWTMANIAINLAGGISVPLFVNISEENFVFEIKHSKIRFLFVCGEEQWSKYRAHSDLVEKAIVRGNYPSSNSVVNWDQILRMGHELNQKETDLFSKLEKRINSYDLASIIYTSGSTGTPKGVELTQRNITSLINQNAFDWSPITDRFLSILPLAHIYGYTLNMLMLGWGIPIYYFNDIKNLGPILQQIHPTIVVMVPRLLEKIYAKMESQVHNSSFLKRKIGELAFALASSPDISFLKYLFYPIADKFIYSKLRNSLGGALRIVITGGAALDPFLCRFFVEIGIPLYEGWGLTEATVITVNQPGNRKIGTVGIPLHNAEIKIANDGEILARAPVVMCGYHRDPEATAAAIDPDGWLHTGDKGTIDEDGYLTIIGRLKELYKTSTGEYIAPVPIEHALCQASFIDMAMVVAENRKFASCLLFPNLEVIENMKKKNQQLNLSDAEFLKSPFMKNATEKLINSVNEKLNHWEQIHAYTYILEPLTPESGALTPSMKIRRDIVAKKYENEINNMYTAERYISKPEVAT